MRDDQTTVSQQVYDLEAAFADLERDGFCVVPDVLSPGEVAAVRARLVAVASEEAAAGINARRFEGPRNQRVYALTHKGDEFVFLLEHPLLWGLMSHVLGPDFLLSSITANIAGPGGQPMALHPDQGYVPPPWPPYPLVANIMWMLDDFTEENGATRFVPGSHRGAVGGPTDQARAAEAIAVTGRAGSVLCFDGRVLHQTGANTTADQLRHGVLTYCCKPWIRQQENSCLSVPAALWPVLSEPLRQLVGLKMYAGLGMIDGPDQRGFRFGALGPGGKLARAQADL
jgi:ectoine hydroxylase-related dioxygenase (phytanoyl-CoA dioxygenase family)